MRILLDTHILLWAISGDEQLPEKARKLIADEENEVYFSIVSPWEVEIKRLNHPNQMPLSAEELVAYCEEAGYYRLPVKENHIYYLKKLQRAEDAPPHKGPFDRIMICQAITESMMFITHDHQLDAYHEPMIYTV